MQMTIINVFPLAQLRCMKSVIFMNPNVFILQATVFGKEEGHVNLLIEMHWF